MFGTYSAWVREQVLKRDVGFMVAFYLKAGFDVTFSTPFKLLKVRL
jgi:hypothetical protein